MAFAVTVKSPMKGAERISRNLGVYAGQISISSYATTLVECTAITKYFVPVGHTNATAAYFPHGIVSMVCDQLSDSGYAWRWDATTGAFYCFRPSAATTLGVSIASSAAGAVPLEFCSSSASLVCSSAGGTGTLSIPLAADKADQCSANDNPGTINFVAVGFIR